MPESIGTQTTERSSAYLRDWLAVEVMSPVLMINNLMMQVQAVISGTIRGLECAIHHNHYTHVYEGHCLEL
jgi:hypothetical protein